MKKILAAVVMALTVMTVGALFASAADELPYYEPYDLSVVTENIGGVDKSFVTFKFQIDSAKELGWLNFWSNVSNRFDMFLIASDSPDGMDFECDYNYVLSLGNNWTGIDSSLTKDENNYDDWTVKVCFSDFSKVKNGDKYHYYYLHLRPCNMNYGVEYTAWYDYGVFSSEAEAVDYFDSCIFLGEFDSFDEFRNYKKPDFSELNKTIQNFEAAGFEKSMYTEDSWENLEDVLDKINNAYPAVRQSDVDALNKALTDAINGLKLAPVITPAPGEDAPVSGIPSAQAKKTTVGGTVTAALRFVWYLFSTDEEMEITSVGAYIIPSANYSSTYMEDAVFVNIPVNSIGIGNTFGADLTDIPEAAFGDTMIAIPYVNGKAYAGELITAVVNEVDIDA